MSVPSRSLTMLADALRQERRARRTRWRRLDPGNQALLVLAYLRKGETYADLAGGFGIGLTTVFRYIREALDVLAAIAVSLDTAMEIARRKAFVIVDGTAAHRPGRHHRWRRSPVLLRKTQETRAQACRSLRIRPEG